MDGRVAMYGPSSTYIIDLGSKDPFGARHELPPLNAAGDQLLPQRWSADGKLLYGCNWRQRCTHTITYDPATRQYQALDVEEGAMPLRDGHRLLVQREGRLFVWDRATRRSTPVVGVEPADFALSPDERWLYFTVEADEADVWLAELK